VEFGDDAGLRDKLLNNLAVPAAALDKLAPHCVDAKDIAILDKAIMRVAGLESQALIKGKSFEDLSNSKVTVKNDLARATPESPSARIAQAKLEHVQAAWEKEVTRVVKPADVDALVATMHTVNMPAADVLTACALKPE